MQVQDPKWSGFRKELLPGKWAGAIPGSEVDATERISQFKTKDEDSEEPPPKVRRKIKKEKIVVKK